MSAEPQPQAAADAAPAMSPLQGQAESAAYLALIERGRNSAGRTLAGGVLILVMWLGLGGVLYAWTYAASPEGSLRAFIIANMSILVMLTGLVPAVAWLQRRPLLTLVTPRARFDWRRAWQGCVALFVIAGLTLAVECVLYPGRYTLNADLGRLWVFVPVILLLTPLQAATEELVFRGYLMQSFYSFTQNRGLIVVVSSVLFAVPHLLNPEAKHGLIVVAQYVVIAAFFAVITLRDGRLELAMGAHAANNVFIAAVAGYPESALDTPALWVANVFDPVYSLVSVLAGSALFYAWFFWRRAP